MDTKSQSAVQNYKFSKTFALFKLIISILYFIPAFFIIGFGLLIDIILLILGAGGVKLQDTSNFISAIGYVSFFSLIPTILSLIIFVLAIIYCVKFFKKRYSKKIDLILCILLIIQNIFYIILFFNLSHIYLSVLLLIFTLIILANILIIIKQKKH